MRDACLVPSYEPAPSRFFRILYRTQFLSDTLTPEGQHIQPFGLLARSLCSALPWVGLKLSAVHLFFAERRTQRAL